MTKKLIATLIAMLALFLAALASAGRQTEPAVAAASESPFQAVESAARVEAPATAPVARRARKAPGCARPQLLVQSLNLRPIPTYRAPSMRAARGKNLPAASIYLGTPQRFWVNRVQGHFGLVKSPWVWPQQDVWINLNNRDLAKTRSYVRVVADLSERSVRLYHGCRLLYKTAAGVGAPSSSSPTGAFWVSDLTPVPAAQYGSFGSYAFGLSTIQPNLPAGWTGGNQMAIHGTGAPASIGRAVSAGCLRISESALRKLRSYLRVGTPVTIRP